MCMRIACVVCTYTFFPGCLGAAAALAVYGDEDGRGGQDDSALIRLRAHPDTMVQVRARD
jgi:hypothetical protein